VEAYQSDILQSPDVLNMVNETIIFIWSANRDRPFHVLQGRRSAL
jgi:hypothetical protein